MKLPVGPPISVRKGGEEEIFVCPSCGKPKLHVNKKKRVWYCFREGIGGRDMIRFADQERGLQLGEEKGFIPHEEDLWIEPELVGLLKQKDNLLQTIYLEYLLNRHVSMEQITRYCYTTAEPRDVGRVILRSPSSDYWVAKKVLGGGPSYLNPPGRRKPWAAFNMTVDPAEWVWLVEGVFDALAMERAGFPTIALLGSHIAPSVVRPDRVRILLDKKNSVKAFELYSTLKAWKSDVEMYFFDYYFPGYKDPAEVPEEILRDRLHE
ncbi:MAG: hypothetical protein ACE5HY_02650 [Candidatus Hydrothermarchaeales archaeon]